MPTPGFSLPNLALLYDIVVQVVLCLPSYVFGTSSRCSSPLPCGGGSTSRAPTILIAPLAGALLVAGGGLASSEPLSPAGLFLSRNCAIATTDSSASTASRIRIGPPQPRRSRGPSGRRRPPLICP